MDNIETITETKTPKKPSQIENLGRVGMKLGDTIGKAFTEFFTGKPPSEEEKIRKAHLRELKKVQDEAQFQNDLKLAKEGKYVPPVPKIVAKKKEDNIFANLGKHNPIADFNQNKSLGTQNFGLDNYGGGKQFKSEDLDIGGYEANPLGNKRRR